MYLWIGPSTVRETISVSPWNLSAWTMNDEMSRGTSIIRPRSMGSSFAMRGKVSLAWRGVSNPAPANASADGYNRPRPLPRTAMDWILLLVAGLLEIGWAIGLKYTEGFTRLWPSVWTAGAMVVSIVLLALALKTIPVGTGYAVWTGIGAAGTAILGIILFAEPATAARLGCIALIVAGIVGLKLVTPT